MPVAPNETFQATIERRYNRGKLIIDVVGAALTCVTWTSICVVVVILLWRTDWSHMDEYGRGMWLLTMLINGVATAIAASTSAAALWALWQIGDGAKQYLTMHRNLFVAIPFAAISTALTWGLMIFALLCVAVIAVPAGIALGILPQPVTVTVSSQSTLSP